MAKGTPKLLEQAAQARRLAASIPDEDIAKRLLKLAEEYEALARRDDEDPDDTVH